MASVAFYLNTYNDSLRLQRCHKSLRDNYPAAPLYIYDDKSSVDHRERIEHIVGHDNRARLLPQFPEKLGWEGYELVLRQLQNFQRIRRETHCDYVFKMDTDTLVLDSSHEGILRFDADLVGNTQWLDPATAIPYYFADIRLPNCTVLGGGYFLKLTDRVERMLDRWRLIPTGRRRCGGGCPEDQAISALVWIAGGKILRSRRLAQIGFRKIPMPADGVSFAVHPVKGNYVS